jgi:hypothetical protein
MAKKKSPKRKAAEAPKLVSRDYLELAWSRQVLPVPESLQSSLQAFDDMASAMLRAEPLKVPSRFELSQIIGETTASILTQPFLRQLVDWLLVPCTSEAQAQRIRFSMEVLPHSRWVLEHPIVEFLLEAWSRDMPENCKQWVPLWCGLVGDARWPMSSVAFMEQLRQHMDAEQAPALDAHVPAFDEVYSWWIVSGLVLGWYRAPDEFREQLTDRAFEEWLAAHPEFLARPQREAYPATRKWEALECLFFANEALLELLPDHHLDDYLMEPTSVEWALDVAQTLEDLGNPQQAEGILRQLAERHPDREDVREKLASVALAAP